MTAAVTGGKPGPVLPMLDWDLILFRRSKNRGIRVSGCAPLYDYLEQCRQRRVLPQVSDVLRSLLPKTARRGLIPRSIEPVPF